MTKFILTLLTLISLNSISFAESIMIAITGGTCSGKTTLAAKISKEFPNDCILISQDFYYRDLSHLSHEQRAQTNFDHPDSLDFSLMREDLIALKDNETIFVPQYDFVTHSRKPDRVEITPKKIIIVEGLHLLAVPEIRELFDLKLFINTPEDVRLIRRIQRDELERGRTVPSILNQYLATVRPMHLEYIEPSKRYANLIIPNEEHNQPALDVIISKLKVDVMSPIASMR